MRKQPSESTKDRVVSAYDASRDAQIRFYQALKDYFPIGSIHAFEKGRGKISGKIINVSRDRVKIISTTQKEYWLNVYFCKKVFP